MTHRSRLGNRTPESRGCAAVLLLLSALAFAASAAQLPYPENPGWYGDPAAPNISGVWVRKDAAVQSAGVSKEGWKPWPPPLKGTFATTWRKRVKDAAEGTRTDEPFRRCLPPGMPRFMSGMTGPLLIIQTRGRVTLYRDGSPVRRIWLDGRALPKLGDREDFYNGNSIGHYEGKDLVTEVAGFKPQPIDSSGIPRSDQMTIQERFHRIDEQTLRVDITLHDAKALSKPMTTSVTYTAYGDPLWEPREFICVPEKNFHPDMYVH
jgi:hypothetical protein